MDDCSASEVRTGCPRGSRREVRREERREAILDVAKRSFFEHGYAGTTMSAIASQLGGSKGTLWSYFPSKELLFEAVLDRATRQFREEMRLTLNPDDPVPDALGKFAEAIIGKMSGDEAITLHRLVVGEAGRFPEMGRIYYRRAPEPTLGLLSDYLSEVMDRGFLRREDPFLAAQNLIGLCHAPSHLRRLTGVATPPTPETTAREANDAVRLFLRAYAPD